MRFVKAVKNFFKLTLAVAFSLACVFCVKSAHLSRLSFLQGERAYYLDSASSQSLVKTELTAWDLFRVQGESVCFTIGDEVEAEKEAFVRALVERLGGEIRFAETLDGTVSYYGYIPKWGKGLSLYGKQINLHIAVSDKDNRCKVGTPIIFGGF